MKKIMTCILCAFFLVGLISCDKTENSEKNSNSDPDNSIIESSENNDTIKPSPVVKSGETEVLNLGKIKLEYDTGYKKVEEDGVAYIYIREGSFMMAENAGKIDTTELTEDFMFQFFGTAFTSFNNGSWSNAEISSTINKLDLNGIDAWSTEFEMSHENGNRYLAEFFVMMVDGDLVSIIFIIDDNDFQDTVMDFQAILDSIEIV